MDEVEAPAAASLPSPDETLGTRELFALIAALRLLEQQRAARAVHTERAPLALRAVHASGVTWQRRCHTCVLTRPRDSASTLLRLAAWRAGGRLPY